MNADGRLKKIIWEAFDFEKEMASCSLSAFCIRLRIKERNTKMMTEESLSLPHSSQKRQLGEDAEMDQNLQKTKASKHQLINS